MGRFSNLVHPPDECDLDWIGFYSMLEGVRVCKREQPSELASGVGRISNLVHPTDERDLN